MTQPSTIENAVRLFNTLSETVQGVVVAGIFSVAGVILTVLVTWWISVRRAAFDRSENAAARAFDLKKEALMQAAEGLHYALGSITLLSNTDKNEVEITSQFQEGTNRATRAFAVGSPDTVRLIVRLIEDAGNTFFSLLPKRIELSSLHTDHSLAQQAARDSLDKQGQLIEQHRTAIIEGREQREIALLSNFIDHQGAQFEKYQAEADAAFPPALEFRVKYGYECLREYVKLQALASDVMASIRTEIGIDKKGDTSYVKSSRTDKKALLRGYRESVKAIGVNIEDNDDEAE